MSIYIFKGSILNAPVDVITNAANSFMRHGAGLARVIDVAASVPDKGDKSDTTKDEIQRYRQWRPGLVPVGGAVLGPPGALYDRFEGIIHAVGPIWGGGGLCEEELLLSAYKRSIIIARQKGYDIALPAISAGIFGVPIHVVADAAMQAARAEGRPQFDIYFALMDDEHIRAFQGAAMGWIPQVVTA